MAARARNLRLLLDLRDDRRDALAQVLVVGRGRQRLAQLGRDGGEARRRRHRLIGQGDVVVLDHDERRLRHRRLRLARAKEERHRVSLSAPPGCWR